MRSILCLPGEEKGYRVHEMVVSSAVEHIFNETAMYAEATGSNRLEKANGASHGSKERVRSVRRDPKDKPKVSKGANGSYSGKTPKSWFIRS